MAQLVRAAVLVGRQDVLWRVQGRVDRVEGVNQEQRRGLVVLSDALMTRPIVWLIPLNLSYSQYPS